MQMLKSYCWTVTHRRQQQCDCELKLAGTEKPLRWCDVQQYMISPSASPVLRQPLYTVCSYIKLRISCVNYKHVYWFIELYLAFLLPLNCNIFVVVSVKIRTLRCTAHSCVCWWEGTVLVAAHRSSGPLLCPVAQPRVQLWSSTSFLHTVVSVHT